MIVFIISMIAVPVGLLFGACCYAAVIQDQTRDEIHEGGLDEIDRIYLESELGPGR